MSSIIGLVFVIVIVIIMLSSDLAMATLLLAAMANIGIILTHANNFKDTLMNNWMFEKFDTNAAAVQNLDPEDELNSTIYSTAFADYESYKKDVDMTQYETTTKLDDNNILMAKRRARDKETIANNVNKDVNFYKYHFAGEIDEYEKKAWWGHYED